MIKISIRSSLLSLVHKRSRASPFSTSSLTVKFLVNSCGFPLESAISATQNFQLDDKNLHRFQSVVQFLKSHGFGDAHLAKMIEKWPRLLHCKLDNLKPKMEFFVGNGIIGDLLYDFISSHPDVLRRSLDSHIKPSYQFLKQLLDSNDKIIAASKRSYWLWTCDLKTNLQPNIEFLLKEGLSLKAIESLMMLQPRDLLQKPAIMVHVVNTLKNFGLQPEDPPFLHAIRVLGSMSESTFRRKMEFMKSMGWTEAEVLLAFKRVPHCLACSEEKLRGRLHFYTNTMNLSPREIIANPLLLKYSIDKRIHPRYSVFNVLKSKKLIPMDKKITWWLKVSEEYFLKNCIAKFMDEVPELVDLYLGTNKVQK
ncbi:hypothetical protein K2173_003606 [Erythroxylum novogranatense]|uniref:Uncharacterized protein n=1 Tax=Erythroxylum novogranatense TaxID=1862640 RepID=A0AAV8TBZ2_9ROSI|nr:hypothetical protein K2173_003606 [Erythroxylum novogranatense]